MPIGASAARIEHGYRFDQEQGLDLEDLRVPHPRTNAPHFRPGARSSSVRLFPSPGIGLPRRCSGCENSAASLVSRPTRNAGTILLRGLSAVWQSAATLSLLSILPFPHHLFQAT